jgi:hypothetical protein
MRLPVRVSVLTPKLEPRNGSPNLDSPQNLLGSLASQPENMLGSEVCTFLRLTEKTLSRMRKKKSIEYIRRGKKYLYPKYAIINYLAKLTVKAS